MGTHSPRAKTNYAMPKCRYSSAAQREARTCSSYDNLVNKACGERKKDAKTLNFYPWTNLKRLLAD